MALPHGNADPERGFSINKNILSVHGFSIKGETLEAIRIVKDFIIRRKGIMNIEITKELLDHCKSSHTRYQCYLDLQKEKEKDEEDQKKKQAEIKESRDQLVLERNVLLDRLKIAEESINSRKRRSN